MNRYTAVFQRDGEWWMAYVEEFPGANSQGATLDEARENLRDAVQLLLETRRELARESFSGAEVIEDLLVAA